MADARDPKKNPWPGDVVELGPQWQRERYSVLGVGTNIVHYQMGPMRAVLQCSLNDWREWALGGEVIHRAD